MARTRKRSYGTGITVTKHPRKPGWFLGKYRYLDLETGKQTAKYASAQSKTEVYNILEAFKTELETKAKAVEHKRSNPFLSQTVEEYIRTWADNVRHNYRKTTWSLYEGTLKTHVYGSDLCSIPLEVFNCDQVAEFLAAKRKGGTSEDTLRRVYKLLHLIFQVAVEEGKLATNPIKLHKSRKPSKASNSDVVALLPEHEAQLLKHVANLPFWNTIVTLALDSGMREGEVLGLQKAEVNLAEREVKVRWSLNTVNNQTHLDRPKTRGSIRDICISQATVTALRDHLKAAFASGSYVFVDGAGKPWRRSQFGHAWDDLVKAAGLPHYGFHSLRHTCATRLLKRSNFVNAVSGRLGHAKPSMTVDIYANAIPKDQRRLADDFDAVLGDYARELSATLSAGQS